MRSLLLPSLASSLGALILAVPSIAFAQQPAGSSSANPPNPTPGQTTPGTPISPGSGASGASSVGPGLGAGATGAAGGTTGIASPDGTNQGNTQAGGTANETMTPPIDSAGTAGARAAGTPPPGSGAGGFMDTRLTWTFGDDDFLHKTGEIIPLSPTFSVGERPQYRLFFDNLNSRFTGRENVTHLVMYKKLPGFIDGLTTEAALVVRLDLGQLATQSGNLNSALYDTGSYLRMFYQTGSNEKTGLGLTFFPLDTDRFRLGYL
jgi:hypothetical protein